MRSKLVGLGVLVLMCLVARSSSAQTVSLTVDRLRAAGNLTIGPTGDLILDPVGNDVYPLTPYDINLGLLSDKFLSVHAAELWVETLVAQNTIATIGGRVLVAPTNILTLDLAPADTTITVKYNNLASGDRIYLEADAKVEFMAVTSSAGGGAGAYTYTVTRDLDGTGANQWYAGDAALDTGQPGDGWIDLYSVRGMAPGTGTNRITNPGAETGDTTGWTHVAGTGSFSASTTYAQEGTYSFAQAATTTEGDAFVGDCVAVTPGENLEVYAYARGNVATTDGYYMRLYYAATCPSGYLYPTTNFDGQYDAISDGPLTTTFVYAGFAYTVPAGAHFVSMTFINWYPNVNATLYVDHVALFALPQVGPTIVGNVRQSSTYNDWAPRWALGNLNGLYGYSATTYGAAFGDQTGTWLGVDATNGIRMMLGPAQLARWDASGNVLIGSAVTGNSNVYLTSGAVHLRSGTTDRILLDSAGNVTLSGALTVGTSGVIKSGATDWTTGTGYYLDYNGGTPRLRIGNPSGALLSWNGSSLAIANATITAPSISAGGSGGDVTIDSSGVTLSTGQGTTNKLKWTDGAAIWSYNDSMRLWSDGEIGIIANGIFAVVVTGASFYPYANSYDLGTSGAEWRRLYLDTGGGITVNGTAGAGVTLACGAGQYVKNLTVYGGVVTAASCGS